MANEKRNTGESIRAPFSRTAPCPCGSGRRYKDCHGSLSSLAATSDTGALAHQLALQALNAQQRQDLTQAKALYQQALKLDPDHADALHMLGVVHYELGDAVAAVPMIMRALDLTGWTPFAMRNNLGLALARLSLQEGTQQQHGLTDKGRGYRARLAAVQAHRTVDPSPTVSVVVPSYNHSAYLRQALESVYAQTYRQIELIVIDDGSTDGSAAIARETLRHCPFPHEFVARDNRGAHATLNEAIGLSSGAYINPLNSDDAFAPTRIAAMMATLLRHDAALVFSNIDWIDAHSTVIDPFADGRVYSQMCKQSNIPFHETVGHAFLTDNVAITTGNLLFSRALFCELGGFRDFRSNHDWDFCLRALWRTEPVHVDESLYRYRFHETNTISQNQEKNWTEALLIHGEYLVRAFDRENSGCEYTPNVARWGNRFVTHVLGKGLSGALPRDILRAYANSLVTGRTQERAGPPVN